ARLAARLTGWHIDIKSASLKGDLPALVNTLFDEEEKAGEREDGRCEYVNDAGIRCRNHARQGSRYCGVHEHVVEAESHETLDDIAQVARAEQSLERAIASEDATQAESADEVKHEAFDRARDAVALAEDKLPDSDAVELENELGEAAREVLGNTRADNAEDAASLAEDQAE
ncbi:MAG: hypothetical protein LBJ48_07450, partial [Coriobacteriales bacterium]|nr:hypothetical protein [Coriobacteriales bacterium]